MVKAIVGANWGDEGKGKITDMLAQDSDIIIRFQGGANAGHTIINDYGKFALHTLPSGIFYDHTTSIIGNGVALNIPVLFNELKEITSKGVPEPKILISDRAQIVMPYHILFDKYEEERLAGKSFGSTKSGIAPFYSDKYAKVGFQVSELFEEEAELKEKIERVIVQKNILLEHLYHKPLIDTDELYNTLMEYMKEKIDSSDIPTSYLLCMKQDCPKATTCLRRIAEQQIGDEVKLWHVISPKYQEKQTDRCAYFRPADKLTYALGFIGMLDRMPYKLMQEAICKLMRRFGRRTYYRVRKGERPLSPDEQKSMLNILKQCGINDPGKFDAYFEAYDW